MAILSSRPLAHPLPTLPEDAPMHSKSYRDGMAYLKRMSAGSKPDVLRQSEWQMAHAHLTLFEMMERVYLFALWAKENDDLDNYFTFCEFVMYQTYLHHQLEEESFFPSWSKASGLDIWQRNVEEHKSFLDPLNATWSYIHQCRFALPKPQPLPFTLPPEILLPIDTGRYPDLVPGEGFDPMALRRHIATFLPVMHQHMVDEISTMGPEIMAKVGEEAIERSFKEMEKEMQSLDPAWFLCLVVGVIEPAMLRQVLPLPWFVLWLLIPLWLAPKYWGAWRYTPHPENLTLMGRP